jgi:uncharacterized membrane protein YdjX (TVP38/TMEM64 family)
MGAIARGSVIAVTAACCIALYPHVKPEGISAYIRAHHVYAPILFVSICAIRPVLFFMPSAGLTIVAGTLFGTAWGTLYVAVGGAISTIVGFYFARWIGRDAARKLLNKSRLLGEFEKMTTEYPRKTVLYMRLFNLPWDLVSYWAGLSNIKFTDFYAASLVPLLPTSFLYTYFGSTIFSPASAGFIISALCIFLLGALPYLRKKWIGKRDGK